MTVQITPFSSTARYRTTPGLIQFEQEANQYVIERAGT